MSPSRYYFIDSEMKNESQSHDSFFPTVKKSNNKNEKLFSTEARWTACHVPCTAPRCRTSWPRANRWSPWTARARGGGFYWGALYYYRRRRRKVERKKKQSKGERTKAARPLFRKALCWHRSLAFSTSPQSRVNLPEKWVLKKHFRTWNTKHMRIGKLWA